MPKSLSRSQRNNGTTKVGCVSRSNGSLLQCFQANPSVTLLTPSDDESPGFYASPQTTATNSVSSRSRRVQGITQPSPSPRGAAKIGFLHEHKQQSPRTTSHIYSSEPRRRPSLGRHRNLKRQSSDPTRPSTSLPKRNGLSRTFSQPPPPIKHAYIRAKSREEGAPAQTTEHSESILYGSGDASDTDDEGVVTKPAPRTTPKPLQKGEEYFPKEELGEDLEFVRYIGHGSYGFVAEGYSHKFNKKVAIKKVLRIFHSVVDSKRLLRELRILRTLKKHDSVVELISIVPPRDLGSFSTLTLVFEYVDTDFAQLLQTPQYFGSLHVQHLMYQLLCGVKYMHSAQIVHRDLKPANILINEDCTLKICDFGLARGTILNSKRPKAFVANGLENTTDSQKKVLNRELTNHVVTRWYRAPEVMLRSQRREFLPGVDMWSVGCIFAEMLLMQKGNCDGSPRRPLFPGRSSFPLSCKDPFGYADRRDQLNVIFEVLGTPSEAEIESVADEEMKTYLRHLPRQRKRDFRIIFPKASAEALDLLQNLLRFDVKTRLSAEEALNHPYLAELRDPLQEQDHVYERFEFEDVPLSVKELRELIVDEILLHNQELQEQFHNQRQGVDRNSESRHRHTTKRGTRGKNPSVASPVDQRPAPHQPRRMTTHLSNERGTSGRTTASVAVTTKSTTSPRQTAGGTRTSPRNGKPIVHRSARVHQEPAERSARRGGMQTASEPLIDSGRLPYSTSESRMAGHRERRLEPHIIRRSSPLVTHSVGRRLKRNKRLSISRSRSPNPDESSHFDERHSETSSGHRRIVHHSSPPEPDVRSSSPNKLPIHIQKSMQTALRINS